MQWWRRRGHWGWPSNFCEPHLTSACSSVNLNHHHHHHQFIILVILGNPVLQTDIPYFSDPNMHDTKNQKIRIAPSLPLLTYCSGALPRSPANILATSYFPTHQKPAPHTDLISPSFRCPLAVFAVVLRLWRYCSIFVQYFLSFLV